MSAIDKINHLLSLRKQGTISAKEEELLTEVKLTIEDFPLIKYMSPEADLGKLLEELLAEQQYDPEWDEVSA